MFIKTRFGRVGVKSIPKDGVYYTMLFSTRFAFDFIIFIIIVWYTFTNFYTMPKGVTVEVPVLCNHSKEVT